MKIGEVAYLANVSIHTIRYYEKLGLLDGTLMKREDNNYRRYTEEVIERIGMVKKGQLVGFSLTEIKSLLDAWASGELTIEERISVYAEKVTELDERIRELQEMRDYLSSKIPLLEAGFEPEFNDVETID